LTGNALYLVVTVSICRCCLYMIEQWAPEDTSTPIKPDSEAAPRKAAAAASRTLDDADRSLAAAGINSSHRLYLYYH